MGEYGNQSNRTGVVVIIIVLVLAVVVGGWYFGIYKPEQEAMEKARLEQIAKQAAEQKRQEQEAQKKERYDQLIEDADAAYEQENWESAYSLYANASSLYSNEQYPKDQLALVQVKLDELADRAAKRAAGIIETVSSPTGRYYVIVSSSIDADLAMDYARKLANEGTSVKIVEHSADQLSYYGVSVGDYDTWDQAANATSTFSSYENGAWVLKN